MLNNKLVKIGLIILAGVVVLYLVNSYNSDSAVVDEVVEEQFAGSCGGYKKDEEEKFFGGCKKEEETFANHDEEEHKKHEHFEGFENKAPVPEQLPKESVSNEVNPSDEYNEVYGNVTQDAEQPNPHSNKLPKDCYPKDQLSPEELLPGNENSKWAQANPKGKGELGDQNFLTAGYHIGVNTVGQSLRNANLQLRSEPPNPQVKVSPWLQSTIEPDTNRKPLEIGGCS